MALKDRLIARVLTRFPRLLDRLVQRQEGLAGMDFSSVPWTPFTKGLRHAKVALVTTAGLHMPDQPPFDMSDPDGDPTWRELRADAGPGGYAITHGYYDHRDAERDINVVFPIDRLKEMAARGEIGALSSRHYGFMGHIAGKHVPTLINESAPQVAERLKSDDVDVVLLTPG